MLRDEEAENKSGRTVNTTRVPDYTVKRYLRGTLSTICPPTAGTSLDLMIRNEEAESESDEHQILPVRANNKYYYCELQYTTAMSKRCHCRGRGYVRVQHGLRNYS